MHNVYLLFLSYTRTIAAAVPRHHKAAYGLVQAACAEVEGMCLANLPNSAAALAASPLTSPLAVLAVGGVLLGLLRHLYARSQSTAWGDGGVAYLPRITDSADVAALAGVVACIAVLFAGAGVPVVMRLTSPGAGSGLTPPSSPKAAGAAAAAAVAGSGYASAGEAAAAAAAAASAKRVAELLKAAGPGRTFPATPASRAASAGGDGEGSDGGSSTTSTGRRRAGSSRKVAVKA